MFLRTPLPETLLVGVSGGVDSMVLLHLLRNTSCSLRVVHVHHGLRGADADADAQLVASTCAQWGIACEVRRVAVREANSTLHQARSARYGAFIEAALQHAVTDIAVAHHANDTDELVAMQVRRFAPPRPVRDMPLWGVCLWRPLLHHTREQIVAYAQEQGIPWREDASNVDPKYARGRLRRATISSAPHMQSPQAKITWLGAGTIAVAAGDLAEFLDAPVLPVGSGLSQAAADAVRAAVAANQTICVDSHNLKIWTGDPCVFQRASDRPAPLDHVGELVFAGCVGPHAHWRVRGGEPHATRVREKLRHAKAHTWYRTQGPVGVSLESRTPEIHLLDHCVFGEGLDATRLRRMEF